ERGAVRLDPGKEGQYVGAEVDLAQLRDLDRRLLLPRVVELEDASHAHEPLTGDLALGDGSLPKPAPRVIPASNLDALAAIGLDVVPRGLQRLGISEEQIEDALGVGLYIAAEASKAGIDGLTGLALEIIEQDVVTVGD